MDKTNYTLIISRSPLFKGLLFEELEILSEELRISSIKYKKEEIIHSEGDKIKNIGILVTGSVRGEKLYYDGEVHLVSMSDTGETLYVEEAASATQIAPVTYIANEDMEVVLIGYESIVTSSFKEQIIQNIIHIMANESIKRLYKIEVLSVRSLRERIMAYLLRMEKRTGSNTFFVNMDRERMAQYLCVNRSALSKELSKMRSEGLIDYRKSTFTILRLPKVNK